ncbi:bacterial regulatory, tetR family protein [Acinetobacter sp. AR_0276]|nr:bacterial regulatory, tetR family protein [Acinetobacter sp. AR_0276]
MKAIELFNEFGYVNVGVDKIISESKVAKMTFYKYFPSKESLIHESLKMRDSLIRESINNYLNNTHEQGINKIKIFFNWYEDWFNREDFFGCMFIKVSDELPYDNEAFSIAMNHKKWATDKILTILNDMDVKDSESLAFQIRFILDGAIVNENLFKNKQSIKSAWRIVEELISKRIN